MSYLPIGALTVHLRALCSTNQALARDWHEVCSSGGATQGRQRAPLMKSRNLALRSWVDAIARHTEPSSVQVWTGTDAERAHLLEICAGQPSPLDVAAGHSPVFVATHRRADAGPTNQWLSIDEAQAITWPRFAGAMRGRAMYVVPYLLGGPRASLCKIGVQITDSPHVVLTMHEQLRVGRRPLDQLAGSPDFARAIHCLGTTNLTQPIIVHFPDTVETWSLGSGSRSNALLYCGPEGLRLASSRAREEGWLAERMTLLVLRSPEGRRWYFAVASAAHGRFSEEAASCGKVGGFTLAQLSSEVCWMSPRTDGRLWAMNPEAQESEAAVGVPLSGLVFSGKQSRSTPLVYEARSWRHGVSIGAMLARESAGTQLMTHDPMSMLECCGYNMGDYFAHWLAVGRKLNCPPKIFHVNWFRASAEGRRLWPGGVENIRVFRWMAERIDGGSAARGSPLGFVPDEDSLDLSGLDVSREQIQQLNLCNHGALLREAESARQFLSRFGDVLPPGLLKEHARLVRGLQESLH